MYIGGQCWRCSLCPDLVFRSSQEKSRYDLQIVGCCNKVYCSPRSHIGSRRHRRNVERSAGGGGAITGISGGSGNEIESGSCSFDACVVAESVAADGTSIPNSNDAEQGKQQWRCTLCNAALSTEAMVHVHLKGKRHRKTKRQTIWLSAVKDGRCEPPCQVHSLGDSHGGKYCFQSMSLRCKPHFLTGSMHSFAQRKDGR